MKLRVHYLFCLGLLSLASTLIIPGSSLAASVELQRASGDAERKAQVRMALSVVASGQPERQGDRNPAGAITLAGMPMKYAP